MNEHSEKKIAQITESLKHTDREGLLHIILDQDRTTAELEKEPARLQKLMLKQTKLNTRVINEKIALENQAEINILIASAIAHRTCTGTEHDPRSGKLHGFCVICEVEWPCSTARMFLKATGENGG